MHGVIRRKKEYERRRSLSILLCSRWSLKRRIWSSSSKTEMSESVFVFGNGCHLYSKNIFICVKRETFPNSS